MPEETRRPAAHSKLFNVLRQGSSKLWADGGRFCEGNHRYCQIRRR
jgi:hypothetical protein